MSKLTTKTLKKFLKDFTKLQPDEALGVFRILNISLINDNKEIKNFDQLLSELMDKYEKLNKHQRRTLDAILSTANLPKQKEKAGDVNGNAT